MAGRRQARWTVLASVLLVPVVLGTVIVAGAPISISASASSVGSAEYEPSPAYPFGRRNPEAPGEIAQFEFMIGACDCVDEIRNPDGSWRRTAAVWNARYFLNGYGIQDLYWSDSFATTNIRIYDPERDRWFVNFFSMPAPSVSPRQWVGTQEQDDDGTRMVMWAGSPDGRNGSRLTFFDIREDGFRWKSEAVVDGDATVGWKSDCRRRHPGSGAEVPKFRGFDANTTHPFGRRHPSAPARFDALDFVVGRHEADAMIRTGSYILNGYGIQLRTFSPGTFESSIVLRDQARNVWSMHRFRMPDYTWAVFEGAGADEDFDLRRTLQDGDGWGDGVRFVTSPGGYDEIATTTGERARRAAFRE